MRRHPSCLAVALLGLALACGSADAASHLTMSWAGQLTSHINACWLRPDGITTTDEIEVHISFELNPDGSLARGPTLIEASPHRLGPIFAESAIAAIKRCQPYSFLPADEYKGGWDKLDMTFSTDAAKTRAPRSLELKSAPPYQYHFDKDKILKALQQREQEKAQRATRLEVGSRCALRPTLPAITHLPSHFF